MLKDYMKSNEYSKKMDRAVFKNKMYKAEEKKYLEVLDGLNLEFKARDNVELAVGLMESAITDLAYEKGFYDGVELMAYCSADGKTGKSKMSYNQALLREDFKQAWDQKADAFNKLMDLLTDHGVSSDKAKKTLFEYYNGVKAYEMLADKLGLPDCEA